MAQLEGIVSETVANPAATESPFAKYLQDRNLGKFYVPLTEYLGIDSIEACLTLDETDIPRICLNIPQFVKETYDIRFKDEIALKTMLKQLIKERNNNIQSKSRIIKLTDEETVYFEQLSNKKKELTNLINIELKEANEENKNKYTTLLNSLKIKFDEIKSKLENIFMENCKILKNIFNNNNNVRLCKNEQNLNNLLIKINEIEKKCMKSFEFDSIEAWLKQRNKNKNNNQNLRSMKQVIETYNNSVTQFRENQLQNKNNFVNFEQFLQSINNIKHKNALEKRYCVVIILITMKCIKTIMNGILKKIEWNQK